MTPKRIAEWRLKAAEAIGSAMTPDSACMHHVPADEFIALLDALDAARETLRKYAGHDSWCPSRPYSNHVNRECICSARPARAALEETKP